MIKRTVLAVLLCTCQSFSCGATLGEMTRSKARWISLTPNSAKMPIGSRVNIMATVKDEYFNVIASSRLLWSSNCEGIAHVEVLDDRSVSVFSVDCGACVVSADVDQARETILITVCPAD